MRRLLGHRFKRTTLWLWLCLGLLGGLGLARTAAGPGPVVLAFVGIFLCFSLSKRSLLTLVLVVALGLAVGWWRGSIYMNKLTAYEGLYDTKLSLMVRALDDAAYNEYGQFAFTAGSVRMMDGRELAGKILVSGFGANAVFQGDQIIITGKLRPTRGAAQGRMSYALIEVKSHHPSLVSEIRRRFVAGAQTALPEPLGPFVMGILVGQRANLPEEVKDDLQKVGLTHIIAVSGANLTIIVHATRKLLGKRSKRVSTFLTLGLIGTFLLVTGFSAPIVRAAIVSTLSIAAVYYGRTFKPLNLIALAAAITAMANPFYLWSDLGWYLSFLGFFGVMILAPLVQARLPAWIGGSLIGGVALESICAEILTLPFVLHIFGQMSRVALAANVLVVTAIPLAMLLGLIAGLAGMLAGSLAGWFAWPAAIVLNYMLDTTRLLASLPNVFVEGIGLALWQMLGLYAVLALTIGLLWFKNPPKSAIITDMNETKLRGLLT